MASAGPVKRVNVLLDPVETPKEYYQRVTANWSAAMARDCVVIECHCNRSDTPHFAVENRNIVAGRRIVYNPPGTRSVLGLDCPAAR